MTYATVRSAAEHIARSGKITPQQLAALSGLDEGLTAAQKQAFTELWRAEGSPAAQQPDPIYLAPAQKIIRAFEGCRLSAYKCPAGIWTIGWGATIVNGAAVREGDTISQSLADELLRAEILRIAAQLHEIIPVSAKWGGNQQAAVLSWIYNVGLGAAKDSTLRRRINAGEGGPVVIPQELPKWDKANGAALPGLTRRRAAEVALFTGTATPPLPIQQGVLLAVPYEAQNDNASGTGYRECFSSSAAMLARFYGKITSDDAYNKFRAKYGDTTDSTAQVSALKALGLNARFVTNCTAAQLQAELDAGRPVLVGWLHKGPVTAPTGGGHWSVVIGHSPTAFIHNDPYGEANLTAGGYANTSKGKNVAYSRANWLKRWLVEGPNSGWALLVSR